VVNRAGPFKDLLGKGTNSNQPFSGRKYEVAVEELLCGKLDIDLTDSNKYPHPNGVAGVYMGEKVEFIPPSTSDVDKLNKDQVRTLENFYKTALYGRWALSDGNIVRNRPLSIKEVISIGTASVDYAPDGTLSSLSPRRAAIYILLPKDGTGQKNLLDRSSDAHPSKGDYNFTTRLEILNSLSTGADYQFYISGAGDFIFEFSQIDFQPDDYGKFSDFLKVDKHLVRSTMVEEQGDIPSGINAQGAMHHSSGGNAPAFIRNFVFSPVLAARYGTVVENETYPFVPNGPLLKAMAMKDLLRKIANSNTTDIQMIYRPFFLPNKPLYNVVRGRMATIDSITQTMNVHGDCTTSVTLNHTRIRRADGRFQMITGGVDTPVSNRKLINAEELSNITGTTFRTDQDFNTKKETLENEDIKTGQYTNLVSRTPTTKLRY
jgi:hypothetical protein